MNLEGWGITPEGFRRPPMSVIKAWVETDMMTVFGPDVVQTAQTPLGQLNGLMIDSLTKLFEFAEQIYLSWDADQAEGVPLQLIGRLRLLQRAVDESEEEFRRAITNDGRARVDVQDMVRAVRNVPGVTYVEMFLPENGQLDEFTVPPTTIAIAVEGGESEPLAEAIRSYLVPGINTFGNFAVSTEIDGRCRSFYIVRPIPIRGVVSIQVRVRKDRNGCPPPGTADMRRAVSEIYFMNGEDVTAFKLRALERMFPEMVEVVQFTGSRFGELPGQINQPIVIGFNERVSLDINDVGIEVVT